jgi:tight adherence protein B
MVFFGVLTFLCIFSLTMLCAALIFAHEKSEERKLFVQMLRTVQAGTKAPLKDLLRPSATLNGASARFESLPGVASLRLSIRQSGSDWSPGKFLAVCAAGAVAGAVAGMKIDLLSMTYVSAGVFCAIGGLAPVAVLKYKRSNNIKAFEEQFPEALDFLTRSLRAGHGFGSGLQMLALETPDPLGGAIRRVSNELQMGSTLDVAMSSLTDAVPLIDVRFFISAVVIQRETGGNLGEILGQLAGLIRERVRLRGKIGALSAHGRITGLVLLLMPVAVMLILSVMSPDYLAGLTKDPTGRKLLIGAAAGQVLAWFSIKKIVNIKV